MSAESTISNPYEAVLADLKARRAQLDSAIAAIEALLAGGTVMGPPLPGTSAAEVPSGGPGEFLGMTIPEAAKKLLATRRQPMRNPDIATAFKAGGLVLNSVDPVNTIGSVLTRRFNEVGDIVRVGRGTWGLKEWYPNRSFKKEKGEAEEAKPDAAAPTKPSAAA